MNFVKFLRTPFLQNTSDGCFCTCLVLKLQLIAGNLNFLFSANDLGTSLRVLFMENLEAQIRYIKIFCVK